MLRELHLSTKVHLFLCNWYKVSSDVYATIFEQKDDHAGEMETSMGLAHFPELVAFEQADAGAVRPSRFEAVNRGWVEITRPWHLLTTNSGSGDPRAATAEKGEELTALVVERIGRFLCELAASPLDRDVSILKKPASTGVASRDLTVMNAQPMASSKSPVFIFFVFRDDLPRMPAAASR